MLPEKGVRVLICLEDGYMTCDRLERRSGITLLDQSLDRHMFPQHGPSPSKYKVIAWCPLPDPYKIEV